MMVHFAVIAPEPNTVRKNPKAKEEAEEEKLYSLDEIIISEI